METQVKYHIALLGKRVEDRVTGACGIVSSVSFDLYGCVQAVVTPPVTKDGEIKVGTWFDINRLFVRDDHPCMKVPNFDYGPIANGDQGAADKPPM